MFKISASFPLKSRKFRDLNSKGPKEFFYGMNILNKNYNINLVDSRVEPKKLTSTLRLIYEKIVNRFTKIGFYKTRVLINKNSYKNSDIIISFNDAYSLNIGLYYKKKNNQKIIGIFHGLSDFESRTSFFF